MQHFRELDRPPPFPAAIFSRKLINLARRFREASRSHRETGKRMPAPPRPQLRPTGSIGPDDGREAPEGPDDLPPLVGFEILDLDQLEEAHDAAGGQEACA